MALDRVSEDVLRNRLNERNAYTSLFGGQLLGQSLAAADTSVEGRQAHSLHIYFLRPGSTKDSIDFQVERLRDGGRFSVRRVTGRQGDAVLFSMTCSYRVELDGFEHQMPARHGDPEKAIDIAELARSGRDLLPYFARYIESQPIEVRIPEEHGFLARGEAPSRHYWLRVPSMGGVDDPGVHRQVLAYLTDFLLPGTSLAPHTMPLPGPHIFVASLDHALWFHRPVRCDQWLLFDTDSPSAGGGTALSRGLIFDQDGLLVATVAQEAMQIPAPL
jgi:acyl-CoA thioesterase-2